MLLEMCVGCVYVQRSSIDSVFARVQVGGGNSSSGEVKSSGEDCRAKHSSTRSSTSTNRMILVYRCCYIEY